MIDLIIQHTLAGTGQEKTRLRTRNTDVAQPTLLLHAVLIHEAAAGRKDALLHARDEHVREFQALRTMQRHQRDILLFVLRLIQLRHKRDIFQIFLQRSVFRLLCELVHRAQEFLNILCAAARLVGILLLILCQQSGLLHQLTHELIERHGFLHSHKGRHHGEEVCHTFTRTGRKACRKIGQCAEQRHILRLRVRDQLRNGCIADGTLRHVDDAPKRHVVGRIRNHT